MQQGTRPKEGQPDPEPHPNILSRASSEGRGPQNTVCYLPHSCGGCQNPGTFPVERKKQQPACPGNLAKGQMLGQTPQRKVSPPWGANPGSQLGELLTLGF